MSQFAIVARGPTPSAAPTTTTSLRTTYENVTTALERFNDCMDRGTRRASLKHDGHPALKALDGWLAGVVASLHPFGPDRPAFADSLAAPLREIVGNVSSSVMAAALGAQAATWKATLAKKHIVSAAAGPLLDTLIAAAGSADPNDVERAKRWESIRASAHDAIADESYHAFAQELLALPAEDRAAVAPSLRDLFFKGDRPRVRFYAFEQIESLRQALDASILVAPARVSGALRVSEHADAPSSLQTVVEELELNLRNTSAKQATARNAAVDATLAFLGSRVFAPLEVAMFGRRARAALATLDARKIHASDVRHELSALAAIADGLPEDVRSQAARLDGDTPKTSARTA